MKKVYLLKGLNCPNCAAKIEKEVGGLDGVDSSAVNLMSQTLTVSADKSFGELAKKIEDIVHSHEPDVTVTEITNDSSADEVKDGEGAEHGVSGSVIRLIIGAVLFVLGTISGELFGVPSPIILALLISSYVILGGDVIMSAVKNIVRGRVFDENFLMSLSTVGAFIIGEYHEAVAVMLFYQIGEFFQELSVERSRRSIVSLMDIRPDAATVIRNGISVTVAPETVGIGELIVIKPGERVPLDGIVTEGETALDTKTLTGESMPRTVREGDAVLSGCINQSGAITVRVTKAYGESTVAKIIDLIENASAKKAPTENFITTFARYYTPAVVIAAFLLAIIPPLLFDGSFTDWLYRGMVFLVVSCPCALVISIPLAFFGGIGAASRHGILVKGGNYLEALNKVTTVVFDKTGTLTKGVFSVTKIVPANGFTNEKILFYAAQAEKFSNHPIAKSITAAYGKELDTTDVSEHAEIAGRGISTAIDGKRVLAGNAELMMAENIPYVPCEEYGTKVYVAVDGAFAGCILISDEIKSDSKKTIADLKKIGIEKTVILTGDDEMIGRSVAEELGIDECYAQLLPADKVAKLEELDKNKPYGKKLAFIGDGINDAPVLARADVGIAMGGLGSDAAIEAADIVLMTDEPSQLIKAIDIAKATKRIVIENIIIALGIKGIFIILGAFGMTSMWAAVFGDVGVALIAVFNAMRIMKK